MTKRSSGSAMSAEKHKDRPPKPDAMPGEVKFRPPMGDKQEPRGLELLKSKYLAGRPERLLDKK